VITERRTEDRTDRKGKATMTRKDFVLIARTIAESPTLSNVQREELALDFARELCSTNPNFDADRFVRAATGEK
jgi:hypothetical protein